MSAPTPGPWRVGFDHPAIKSGVTEANPEAIAITSLNTGLALGGVVALAYTEGDARLIAAAPDLWASLTELHDYLREHGSVRDTLEMLTRSHNALARVSGGQP